MLTLESDYLGLYPESSVYCVTLGKLPNFSRACFLGTKSGDDNITYFIGFGEES